MGAKGGPRRSPRARRSGTLQVRFLCENVKRESDEPVLNVLTGHESLISDSKQGVGVHIGSGYVYAAISLLHQILD